MRDPHTPAGVGFNSYAPGDLISTSAHDREPDAEGSSRNEQLSEIDEASKPENLAGYKDQEQGEEDQIETAELIGTCDEECNTSKDQ